MDNTHWIKRRIFRYQVGKDNCRVMLQECNQTLNGNYEVYTPRIKRELGPEKVVRLEQPE